MKPRHLRLITTEPEYRCSICRVNDHDDMAHKDPVVALHLAEMDLLDGDLRSARTWIAQARLLVLRSQER